MRVPVRLLAVALLVAIAAPLRAQIALQATPDTNAVVAADSTPAPATVTERTPAPSAVAGPTLAGMRAGVHARETSRPAQPTMAMRGNLGQDRALMVVGVAALITGAIIGGTPGTVIMVGGAVVGLLGLYDYLQ